MIANMAKGTEIGRLLVWRAGWLKNQGLRNTRETSPRQVARHRARGPGRARRDPDPRRQRLLQRVPGRALPAQLEGRGHLRGHEPAAHADPGRLRPRLSRGPAASAASRGRPRAGSAPALIRRGEPWPIAVSRRRAPAPPSVAGPSRRRPAAGSPAPPPPPAARRHQLVEGIGASERASRRPCRRGRPPSASPGHERELPEDRPGGQGRQPPLTAARPVDRHAQPPADDEEQLVRRVAAPDDAWRPGHSAAVPGAMRTASASAASRPRQDGPGLDGGSATTSPTATPSATGSASSRIRSSHHSRAWSASGNRRSGRAPAPRARRRAHRSAARARRGPADEQVAIGVRMSARRGRAGSAPRPAPRGRRDSGPARRPSRPDGRILQAADRRLDGEERQVALEVDGPRPASRRRARTERSASVRVRFEARRATVWRARRGGAPAAAAPDDVQVEVPRQVAAGRDAADAVPACIERRRERPRSRAGPARPR